MELVIYNYIDSQGAERIAIGDYKFMKGTLDNSKQLIKYLGRNMNEEQRDKTMDMDKKDLLQVLANAMENNKLKVFYPN